MPRQPATRCRVAAARNRARPRWPCGCRTGTGTSARSYRRDSAGYPDPLSPDYPAEQLEDYRTGAGTGDFRATAEAGYPDVPVTGDYRRTGPQPADYPDEASSGSYPRGGGRLPG